MARLAENVLTKTDQDTMRKALEELSHLTSSHPDMIVNEKDHPFTECATFADAIKLTFGAWQNDWHFIDQPYLDEPGTKIEDFDFVPNDVDVISALNDFTAFLSGRPDM